MKKRRPYQEIIDLVQAHGGTMEYIRTGYQWGAWIVRIGNKERVFRSNGSGYPDLAHLYVVRPRVSNPSHWRDYSLVLVDGAWEKFMKLFSEG